MLAELSRIRRAIAVIALVVAALPVPLWGGPAGAAGRRVTVEHSHVDDVDENPFEQACGRPIEDHSVGTNTVRTLPDGTLAITQNLLVTSTALDGSGDTITYRSTMRITDVEILSVSPGGG